RYESTSSSRQRKQDLHGLPPRRTAARSTSSSQPPRPRPRRPRRPRTAGAGRVRRRPRERRAGPHPDHRLLQHPGGRRGDRRHLEKCAAELGLTFSRERVPGDQLIAKVLQMGSSRTLPDLLMLDNPNVQQVAASGALAPLEPYGISTEGITPAVAELGMYEDTLYGIAPTVNTIALFYDAAALEEAGIAPPTTWDELREAAAALTTPERYGLAFSAIASYEGTWQFLPFMWSDGGDETDLDGEGVIDASRFWADLVREGLVSRSVVNWGQGD